MKASGASTNALASASGLSSTMAMSLHLLQDCYALFSQRFRSHFSIALCARDPVCGGTVRSAGVPSAKRNALSGNVAAGTAVMAITARRMSLSWMFSV